MRKRTGFVVLLALLVSVFALRPALVAARDTPANTTTAVSMWVEPKEAGKALDAADPNVANEIKSALLFAVVIFDEPVDDASLDAFATATSNTMITGMNATNVTEPTVTQVGKGARGVSFNANGLSIDLLFAYQDTAIYMFMSLGVGEDRSAISTLDEIAVQTLAVNRTLANNGLLDQFAGGFAPNATTIESRPLSALPNREEVPDQYQMLDEDVFIGK